MSSGQLRSCLRCLQPAADAPLNWVSSNAACSAAEGPAIAAGPEAEVAAAATCLAIDALGAGGAAIDITDDENSVALPNLIG